MTSNERIARVRAKVERAQRHLGDLETEIRSFLRTGPYQIASERDPQTGEVRHCAKSVTEVPLTISAGAGDVLHNLRGALDHLACELVIVGGNYPTRNTGFPIFASFAIYKAQAPAKVQGMREDAVEAIEAIKPYKGGNDTLWRLHFLSNIDKRRLPNTVGLVYRFQEVTPSVLEYLRKVWSSRPSWPSPDSPGAARLFDIDRRHSPLMPGDVVLIEPPNADVTEQKTFQFDVTFQEDLVYGRPAIETLAEMLNVVDEVVLSFRPLLA